MGAPEIENKNEIKSVLVFFNISTGDKFQIWVLNYEYAA